jgi:hypothetical protein
MADPWAFGWTQVFTLAGLIISVCVSIAGLRTFGKWQREKLEERKMDIAFEALSIAYESKFIFDDIRVRLVRSFEYEDMPDKDLSEAEKQRRSSFYAVMKRIEHHKDFFERALVLLPRFLAVFGKQNEATYLKLLQARNEIYSSCEALIWDLTDPKRGTDEYDLYLQLRANVWAHESNMVKEPRRVSQMIEEFQSGIERLCQPFVDREFGKSSGWWKR